MTGKRFTIGDRALQEVYGGCIPAILDGGIPCTQSEVLKLLNELHEENQERKRAMRIAEQYNEQLLNENKKLKKYLDSISKGGLE